MIKFNEVTWYSKLAAIIFFIGIVPTLTFYIGTQYQEAKDADDSYVVASAPAFTSHTEGCVRENGTRNATRTCVIRIFDTEPLYTFKYDSNATIEVSKEGKHLQNLTLPQEKIDVGLIHGFMHAVDVNFDGTKDLAVRTCQGATGNQCFAYFLYVPQTGKFEYSAAFTETGGYPQSLTKQIRTHWNEGCAGECFVEKTYKVENNQPILIQEISQNYDSKNQIFTKVVKDLKNGRFVTATSTVKER